MGLSAMHPLYLLVLFSSLYSPAFILRPSHSSWALLVLKNEGLQALKLAIKGGVIVMYMAVPADRIGFLGLGRDGFGHL